ncbi:ABC transporter ATP-binding protein [Luedemannella helvata]|uniref:ABC transporter ATP-binding protein n=1 Tax=Luedemannella helvata TaxID=349315 RepID=UPI0031E316A3
MPEEPDGDVMVQASADSDVGIWVRGVTRRFGTAEALRGIDLSAPYGRITALVGPNGAGKTTLLLILATLLTPTAGQVRVAGLDPVADPDGVRSRTGWMPDALGVYEQLTPREYLAFFAEAYRIEPALVADRVAALLARVHLAEHADQPVHVLSRGQKQRLGLARALVHEPRVLLLDEPAAGLDPRSRSELRDLLRELAASGVAILVSSHILAELEELADRVVFVAEGRTVSEEEIAGVSRFVVSGWRVRALDDAALATALAARGIAPLGITAAGSDLPPMSDVDAAALLASLVGDGVPVIAFGPIGGQLEAAYLALNKERR